MRLLTAAWAAVALGALAIAGCKPAKLPEQETAAGQLYLHRCGQCHSAYNPQSMTTAMWQLEVPKMEDRIRRAGLPPLAPDQEQTIVEYLTRNAGTQ